MDNRFLICIDCRRAVNPVHMTFDVATHKVITIEWLLDEAGFEVEEDE